MLLYTVIKIMLKNKLVTIGADATLHTSRFLYDRHNVATAPAVTGLVFMQRFGLFLGQCIQEHISSLTSKLSVVSAHIIHY